MSDKTGIAWTDSTWNPLRARHKETGAEGWACVRVSPGCQHCYAETLNENQRFRRGTGLGYTVPALAQVEHYLHEKAMGDPLRWQKPRRIFVCSMTDLFGEWVTDDQIDRIFAVMALAPRHTFQVLTKRPERMRAYLSAPDVDARICALDEERGPRGWPLPNVWIGITAEDQERAAERLPLLLDTPAAVRFVSYEPALGPVDFTDLPLDEATSAWFEQLNALTGVASNTADKDQWPRLDWLIVGGESGSEARPFDVAWARAAVAQGRAAGVAVFVKQMGSHVECIDIIDAADHFPGAVRLSRGRHPSVARVHLKHPHGANPDEWPEALRVQEFPEAQP